MGSNKYRHAQFCPNQNPTWHAGNTLTKIINKPKRRDNLAIKVNGKLVAGLWQKRYEQARRAAIPNGEEFISALANIGSNPTAEGLPVNDVRTGTVRDGQSIAAGDVVNVQDGEIYHDVVAQKNVENQLNTVVRPVLTRSN